MLYRGDTPLSQSEVCEYEALRYVDHLVALGVVRPVDLAGRWKVTPYGEEWLRLQDTEPKHHPPEVVPKHLRRA